MDNNDEKLVNDLKEQISSIPASISSIEELRAIAEPLCDTLCNYYNYTGDKEEIINRVMYYLNDFIGKAITEDDLIKNMLESAQEIIGQGTMIITTDTDYSSSSSGTGSRRRKSSKATTPSTSNDIVDVDTDLINKVSQYYAEIQQIVENNTLTINDGVSSAASILCSDLTNYIKNTKTELVELLDAISKKMKETMNEIIDIDDSISPVDLSNFNFNDIWKTTTKWVESKPLRKADADFFRNNGCEVKDGVAIFKNGNKTYAYDIKKRALTVTNNKTGGVTKSNNMTFDFYIPTNGDYSKCNTLTAILSPKTPISKSSGIIIKAGIEDTKKGISQNLIAESTRFMNGVAKTDLKNCQNAIIGGSQWGARAIDIAARTGNLYKTVYCVNNALIVNGENGVPGGKYKIDASVLKNLNGKNIYFVSSNGDPNTYKRADGGNPWPNGNCQLQNSYLYTGLEILLKNCPNAQVYMISNNPQSDVFGATKLTKYSNYHYKANYWNKIMKKNYNGHAYGGIVQDIINSGLVGYNGYNGGTLA